MRIHFIGKNGVSMRTLMWLAEVRGIMVSGSDMLDTGHDASFVEGADLVVYTAAIPLDNVELVRAKQLKIPLMTRGEFLGQIVKSFALSVAVAGTHGKTTTTAMLWEVCFSLNPTVHIGGEYAPSAGSRVGFAKSKSKKAVIAEECVKPQPVLDNNKALFITEACEYKKSFLHLSPDYALILNTDLDHTDCYKSITDIKDSFKEFGMQAKKLVFINGDEKPFFKGQNALRAGLSGACDIRGKYLKTDKYGRYGFGVYNKGERLGRIQLSVAGRHNVYNALFVIGVCLELGLSFEDIAKGLSRFNGLSRRMEFLRTKAGCDIYSDYAHHPKEIDLTIQCMKECKYEHITAVFEPHTYTRTASFLSDFADSLAAADTVVLLPVFAAREMPVKGGASDDLARVLKSKYAQVYSFKDYPSAGKYLKKNLNKGGVVLFMGAGTVDGFAREFAVE